MHPFSGIRRVLRVGARSAELNEELTFHFERTIEELVAKGLSPRQAEEEARRRFGDEVGWRGEIDRIDRSVAIRRGWVERLRTGGAMARYAARRIRRSPGLALGVVLTFGLGIGANATMFSIVDRLLLSPPPHIENPDEIRRLLVGMDGREGRPTPVQSYPAFRDISAARSFSDVAGYAGRQVIVGQGEDARPLSGMVATSNYFTLLGVRPALGRFYTSEEDRSGGEGVVVISHDLWHSMYGGSADVLDASIDFGYGPYAIIGVAPAGFTGIDLHGVDLWLPLHTTQSAMWGASWEENRHSFWMGVIGRLAPGVTESAASDEATALLVQGEQAAGIDSNRVRVVAAPLLAGRGPNAPPETAVARWLVGLSALVLLIACANVANLLLASIIRQRREVGIRLALGSSRARIMGQVLAESALLAALGGIAAIVLARVAGGALSAILLPDVVWRATGLEWRISGLVLLLSALAGLAAGVVPAIEASRPRLSETLRSGGRGHTGGGRRARAALTIVQTALSLVLLVGSGLFVRSLQRARAVDLGFDPAGVLLFNPEYERGLSDAQKGDIMRRTRLRLLELPGVESVSGDVTVPFQSLRGTTLRVPGVDSIPGGAAIHVVDSGYFSTVGLRIVRGRAIDEDDTPAGERVALVNETMARKLWPGEDALGKCLIVGNDAADAAESACSTVVGIAEDSRNFALVEDPSMHYFVPAAQEVVDMYPDALLVRVTGEAGVMIAPIRQTILQAESALRYAKVNPLQALIDPTARSWRLGASMFTAFGLLALLVAGIGLYSVLAFGVAERTQELGIRAALGAGRERLIGLVVVRAMTMVAVGVGLGLVVAMAVAGRIEPLLFEVGGRDPLILATAALSLILVGALASWIPALRATRVDPGSALRAD